MSYPQRSRSLSMPLSTAEVHRMRQRTRIAGLAGRKWAAFHGVGDTIPAVCTRLALVWLLALPILVARAVVSLFLIWMTMGMAQLITVTAVTGGTVTFHAVYREVVWFAASDENFQIGWDIFAHILALVSSIFVWLIRLAVEIWNGLCPFVDMFAQLMLVMAKSLALLWFNVPVLQYMFVWLLRLTVYMIEPIFDAIVTVFETFVYLLEGLTAIAKEGGETGLDAIEDDGERLLRISVLILSVFVRMFQAFLVAFSGVIFGAFRYLLPMLLPLVPIFVKILVAIGNVLISDASWRVIMFVAESVPIIAESLGAIICDIVIYGGSAACYLLYGVSIMLSFILEYIVRPCICGILPLFAGCLRPFMESIFDGDSCYACNGYNTACGCKYNVEPRDAGSNYDCDAEYCFDKDAQQFSAPPQGEDDFTDGINETSVSRPFTAADDDGGVFGSASSSYPEEGVRDVDLSVRRRSSSSTEDPPSTLTVAIIAGSPNFYAPVSMSLSTDRSYTWGAMPVYPSGSSNTSLSLLCLYGIDTSCAAATVHDDLDLTAAMGTRQLQSGGRWQPVTWYDATNASTSPWIRVYLAHNSNVTEIRLVWGVDGNLVRGPARIALITDSGVSTERTSLSCWVSSGSIGRTDTFYWNTTNVSWIHVKFLDRCDTRLADHVAYFSLHSVRVLGHSTATATRYVDLTARAVHAGTKLWDSCGVGTLDRLIAKDGVPVGLIGNASTSGGVVLSATNRVRVTSVVVRLAGAGRVRREAIWLCPRALTRNDTWPNKTDCVHPLDVDGTHVETVDFRSSTLAQELTPPAIFTPTYYSGLNDPGLGATWIFDVDFNVTDMLLWIDDLRVR